MEVIATERHAPPGALDRLNAEAQLLCLCSRVTLDEAAREQVARLVASDLDWEFVLRQAAWHGVLPLMSKHLLGRPAVGLDEEVASTLGSHARTHARRSLRLTGELLRVARLFERDGIPYLPLKGPVLALLAFGDVALRMSCDLDVLVPSRDVTRAVALLEQEGYRVVLAPSWLERLPLPTSSKKDVRLRSRDGEVTIELHWRLSGRHFDLALGDDLWQRLERFQVGAVAVPVLPFSEHLVYLCTHGTRHGWERLIWLADVAELVRARPESDLHDLLERAGAHGCERSVGLALRTAHDLLGAEVGSDVLARIDRDGEIKALSREIGRFLFRDHDETLDIAFWRRYHLSVRERARERLAVSLHYAWRYARVAVRPNEKDRALVALPAALAAFYIVLRPLRLLLQAAIRAARW